MIDDIIAYESGQLGFLGSIKMFSALMTSGQILGLQGSYYRTASHLVTEGLLEPDGSINWDAVDNAESYGM